VTVTRAGYIKRAAVSIYPPKGVRPGRRGLRCGKRIPSSTCSWRPRMTSCWCSRGRKSVLAEGPRGARGEPLCARQGDRELLPVTQDEKVAALVAVKEFDPERFLLFATRKGKVKKTELDAYSNPRSTGIIAVALEEGDICWTSAYEGKAHIFLGTHKGMGIRFPESNVGRWDG